jgi:transketolase
MRAELPADFNDAADAYIAKVQLEGPEVATRKASQMALDAYGPHLPELIGGSADLAESNLTIWKGSRNILAGDAIANYVHYGVREFAMTAISTGLALHGGFLPYDATFLVFSDYARNAVRMSALMHQRVILVYTHDSIGLGEDGPTHQPVEHVASLRLLPNLNVWRPADAYETAAAWIAAIERDDGPTALVLTRQGLPQLARGEPERAGVARGGYVLLDAAGGAPECIVIAAGSEVALALPVVQKRPAAGRRVRLVSMPSTDIFDAQDAAWREAVLPAAVTRRLAVEAGATGGWWKYVGLGGRVLGVDQFGASGKAPDLFRKFGLTPDNVERLVLELLV